MKKILQYGLYVLMASAFVDVNAVKPSLSSTSSDQLTSEQRAAKMSAPTVDVAKAYDKFLDSSASEDEMLMLYGHIMRRKDWIARMPLDSRQDFKKTLAPLVSDLVLLGLDFAICGLSCGSSFRGTFSSVDECLPYFNVVSILKSQGETLEEAFFKSKGNPQICFDLKPDTEGLLEGKSKEEYIRLIHMVNVLYNAGMGNNVRIAVNENTSDVLSQYLNLQGNSNVDDTCITFYGNKSNDEKSLDKPTAQDELRPVVVPFHGIERKMRIREVFFENMEVRNENALQDFIEDHEVEMVGLKAAGDAVDLSKTSIKKFYCGKVKSAEEVRSLRDRLPETVDWLYLTIEDDVALESQFEIFETTLECFPHITDLMLGGWQVKLSPAIIDCASSHRSLRGLVFCDKNMLTDIFLDPSNEEMLKEMREKLI